MKIHQTLDTILQGIVEGKRNRGRLKRSWEKDVADWIGNDKMFFSVPMSVDVENCLATTEMKMVRWSMGVSLLEHRRSWWNQ